MKTGRTPTLQTPLEAEIATFGQDTQTALKALSGFTAAQNFDGLWQILVDHADALDADLLSYHHHAPEFAPDRENVTVRTHGFPEAWVNQYIEKRQHQTDPITQVFATRVRPLRWSEVDKVVPVTPPQAEYLASLRRWMTGDGIGFPVFGPGGRHGYVGIGRSKQKLDDWGLVRTNRLHWVLESFHMRWCELVLMSLPQDFTLSARELAILESLSIGMSDEVICGVVGAQVESVRRSIRKIMKKMGVSDRPSAILRGVGAGLLKPSATTP